MKVIVVVMVTCRDYDCDNDYCENYNDDGVSRYPEKLGIHMMFGYVLGDSYSKQNSHNPEWGSRQFNIGNRWYTVRMIPTVDPSSMVGRIILRMARISGSAVVGIVNLWQCLS